MKTKSEGFLTPRTATSNFNSEVIQAWQRESMILSDWINVFNLANLSEADKLSSATKLTATDLENRQVILSKSLAFQTPGGGKRKFKDETASFTPYKRMFMADDLPSTLNSDEVFTILQNLELAIVNLENATAQIISHQRTMSTTLTDSSDSSTQKFNHLLMQVGRKPSDLFAKYDAPDLWMAIANLASLLESIPTTSESDLVTIINLSVQRLKGEMKEHVKTTLGVNPSTLYDHNE